jgi:hypothetical protein
MQVAEPLRQRQFGLQCYRAIILLNQACGQEETTFAFSSKEERECKVSLDRKSPYRYTEILQQRAQE